ncbi:MAG: hypothetical protein AABY22_05955, partial [Nanoarchaeota archaeon]
TTNISALDFIEFPSIQSLNYSVEKLHILGFIDENYDITTIGYYADKMKFISVELRKMIFSGYFFGASILDLITITAFVSMKKFKVFEKKFKIDNFMKLNDKEFEFYNQIVIADDFINCIFIWNIFQEFIEKNISKTDLSLEKIKGWCEKNFIKFDGFVKVISMRDDIIENMLEQGFNPYYNGLGIKNYNLNKIMTSLPEGLAEVKKIKQCLYEGFKCNLLIHETNSTYKSVLKNIPIRVKSAVVKQLAESIEQRYPMYIVISDYDLSIKDREKSSQYEFLSQSFICVLDNFIDPDLTFFLH